MAQLNTYAPTRSTGDEERWTMDDGRWTMGHSARSGTRAATGLRLTPPRQGLRAAATVFSRGVAAGPDVSSEDEIPSPAATPLGPARRPRDGGFERASEVGAWLPDHTFRPKKRPPLRLPRPEPGGVQYPQAPPGRGLRAGFGRGEAARLKTPSEDETTAPAASPRGRSCATPPSAPGTGALSRPGLERGRSIVCR